MANEINFTTRLKCNHGNLFIDRNVSGQIDQAGTHMSYNVERIYITPTLIVITNSVAIPGMTLIRNLDDTNFVEVGFDAADEYTAQYPLKLMPGESMIVRLNTETLYAPNIANVDLEVLVLED